MIKKFINLISVLLPVMLLAQAPGGVATDLSVWYKADNGVTTNATKLVTQWNSSSATNVVLTPNGTVVLPYNDQTTYTSTWNFNPTVTFNGTNNYLRNNVTAYLTSAGSVHYIVVAKGTNRSATPRSLFAIRGDDDGFFYSGGGGNTAFPTIGNSYNSAAAAITSPDDFGIYAAILPKTLPQGIQRGYYNGLRKNYLSPYPIGGATYVLPTSGAYMGADGTSGDNFFGDIAEVIIYHSPIGNDILDADLERIHSYLAVKYGITLTSTQNYLSSSSQIVWDATSNLDYANNIFGIARDDNGTLHQKQSRSENSNQKLIIGHGSTLSNTNILNTNSLTDGQFLLVGDNGLEQKLKTPLSYTAGSNGDVNFRFEAVWKVQNTNSVDEVTIAWPVGINNLYLVQSTNETFAAGNTFTPMTSTTTVNGTDYNTATVILTDGSYFTFAGFAYAPGGVLDDLGLWTKADSGFTSALWTDFSINENHLTQNTTGLQPSLVPAGNKFNFNPSVNFDSDVMENTQIASQGNNNMSLYSVASLESNASSAATLIGIGASGNNPHFGAYPTGRFMMYPSLYNNAANPEITLSSVNLMSGHWQHATAGTARIEYNGFTARSGGNQSAPAGNFVVGTAAVNSTSEPWVGFVPEVIAYVQPKSGNENQRISSYLGIKYGLTLRTEGIDTGTFDYLSSASTIVWNGADNAAYHNNVLGIARDNISALHQKQSKSVNSGQKLIIGAGSSLFDTNADNTNTLTEGQFLLTGDNGLSQSLSIPFVYTSGTNGETNFRFEAVWKVQNTNNVGQVTIAWPVGINNLYLVQSTDETFASGNTFRPMTTEVTINGVDYNTVTTTLADEEFFTFAGFAQAPGGVVANLLMWHKADDGVTTPGQKSTWQDISQNDRDVTQNDDTARQPNLILDAHYSADSKDYFFNFNPFYYFDGGDVFYRANDGYFSASNSPGSIYDVIVNGGTGTRTAFGFSQNDNRPSWTRVNDDYRAYSANTAFTAAPAGYSATTMPAHIGSISWAGSAPGISPGINGHTSTGNASININMNGPFSIGSQGSIPSEAHLGGTAEVFAYSIDHQNSGSDEKQRINSYLAVKYGITLSNNDGTGVPDYLSSASAIVWNATANTDYNNNIFGIAQDFPSALHQKQSASVNAGQKLIIGTGTSLAETNAANTNTLADGQFLMVGDNGLEQKLKTPLVYTAGSNGATSFRFESVWKVQNTNSVGQITVAWPVGIENLYLVQSTDETFDTEDTFTPMTGTITVNGTDYNTATVTLGDGQYFTFAGLVPDYCVTGDCNPNTFLNTSDPNTIEYDNMVSTFHDTMMRNSEGKLFVWGDRMANNGTSHVLSPMEVNSTNYPTLTGDILKFTGGGSGNTITSNSQSIVLTTDGLFAWRVQGKLIASGLTSSAAFQSVSIGTYGVNGGAPKADGLPDGVAPEDVKMLFGTNQTLALTTCSGEAWVLAQQANTYGDGATSSTANHQLWHRVHTDASTTLDNVVAIRGGSFGGGVSETLMALTATGEVYTWGTRTRLGNGTAVAARPFATPMTLPAGITPKMIGFSVDAYYILGTNGNLYALGENNSRQLGNFTNTASNSWVQVQKSASAGDYLTDVVYISPNEHHSSQPAINVLTADGRLWAWGHNDSQMLGGSGTSIHPTEMPGSIPSTDPYDIGKLNWTDKVIAVETGGHTSMIVKDNSKKYGYVGHRINGSMGDGTSTNAAENEYNFADTPEIDLCGAPVEEETCTQPGATGTPDGFTKVGVSTLESQPNGWPENIPNGWITMESKTKGFVITRVQHVGGTDGTPDPSDSIADPQEGMLVYDIDDACVKLFNGTIWNCIERSCND